MSAEVVLNRADRRAAWPKRRQWLDRIAADTRLTTGAKAWLMLLAERSDDTGKPVWGNQVKMAQRIGRCDRSVRRYRAEAEALGYVVVYRSKPQRGPSGRWCRRKANAYYLRLPAKSSTELAAPRRRQRAGYCVVPPRRPAPPIPTAAPVLADSDGRSSPLRGAPTSAAPPNRPFMPAPTRPKPPNPTERAAVAALIADMKTRLRHPTTTSAAH